MMMGRGGEGREGKGRGGKGCSIIVLPVQRFVRAATRPLPVHLPHCIMGKSKRKNK